MKLLIDECLHPSLVSVAHAGGHSADHVSHRGLSGLKDWQLMRVIREQEYTFVTNNRSDFLDLHGKEPLHAGVGARLGGSGYIISRPVCATTHPMTKEVPFESRRYERISLPQGMSVAWNGGGQQQVSRVKALAMGGAFLCGNTVRVGTELTLVFQLPGGILQAEAVVRNIVLGEGMGVEFTKMNPEGRILLEQLLTRLLR